MKPRQSCPWYRFSEYQIRDGRIVPRADARATRYSLVEDEDRYQDRRGTNANRTYARLLQVVTLFDDFDDDDDPSEGAWIPISSTQRPSEEIEGRILQFSSEFGLLGILHRRYNRIVEPHRLRDRHRTVWERGGFPGWSDRIWRRTLILDKPERYSLCIGAPGQDSDATFEELNRTYFGGLKLKAIPSPDSEDFFRMYGEPVDLWIVKAVELADAIRNDDDQAISALLRASWTDYVFGPSGARATFRAGSLLEGIALHYIEDHNAGFVPRYCENTSCARRLYYDNDPRSRFCSKKCASAQRQRDYREAQKRLKATWRLKNR
jgi:hypothetical protein